MYKWPLNSLRLITPACQLRLPTENELGVLAERAQGNLLDPADRRFMGQWTQLASPAFEQGLLQMHWRERATWTPERWNLVLAVFTSEDPDPVGFQRVGATDFARSRTVDTGSWLIRSAQGAGLGTWMRRAALELAFTGLSATTAITGSHPENRASCGVTEKLGYEQFDTKIITISGSAQPQSLFRLSRERFERNPDVTIVGLDSCRSMFEAADVASSANTMR